MRSGHGVSQKTTILGWSMSGLFHCILLAAAAVSVHLATPRADPQKEPFRWEVSLSAAPHSEAVLAAGAESSSAPASTLGAQSSEVQDTPASERIVDAPIDQEGLQANRPHPITPAEKQVFHSPPGSQTLFEDVHLNQEVAMMPAARLSASHMPPPEVENQPESEQLEIETRPEDVKVLQRPQAVTRTLVNRTVLPDYGWLMETMRSKLEAIKTYPSAAKAVHAQGLVVIQVLVDSDGRLMDPEIKESSGSALLDHAALDAILAASPLKLAHRLERVPLVMLVPLNYRLE
ncbi:MAG: TonB family protein [Nitrospira sp.]